MREPVFSLQQLYKRLAAEPLLTAWHVSLMMAIMCEWENQGCKNPVNVNRRTLMQLSRIRRCMTYHKCIRQLQEYQLIHYSPSYNPLTGSVLYISID